MGDETAAMNHKQTATHTGVPVRFDIGMLIVVLIWGLNFVVLKAAFIEIPPLAFTALRFVITSMTFGLILGFRKELRKPEPGNLWRFVWLGFIGNTAYQVLFAIGLSMTTAANSAMLLSTTPALLALCGGLLGIEKITRRMLVAIGLAVSGVALVMSARGTSFSESTAIGDLITLLSVFCWVAYVLGVRTVSGKVSSLQLTALSMIAGTPGLILLGAPQLARLDWGSVSTAAWLGLMYSTFLSLIVAYLLYNRSVRRIGSVQTSIYGSGIPVIAALAAWAVLDEKLTWLQGIGAALIIAGLVASRRDAPQEIAKAEDVTAVGA